MELRSVTENVPYRIQVVWTVGNRSRRRFAAIGRLDAIDLWVDTRSHVLAWLRHFEN